MDHFQSSCGCANGTCGHKETAIPVAGNRIVEQHAEEISNDESKVEIMPSPKLSKETAKRNRLSTKEGTKAKKRSKKASEPACKPCRFCPKQVKSLRKGACGTCYRKHLQPKVKCSRCPAIAVRAGVYNGGVICQKCYRALDLAPKTQCVGCKNMRARFGKDEDGAPVCKKCYKDHAVQPTKKCAACDEIAVVGGKNKEGLPVCKRCYGKKFRPKKKCANCDEVAPQAATDDGGNPICKSCYAKLGMQPKRRCAGCDEMAPAATANDKGEPICKMCYPKYQPKKECSGCKKIDVVHSHTVDGDPVCATCYERLELRPKTTCARCSKLAPQNGTNDDGNPLCASCYHELGLRPKHECGNCGEIRVQQATKDGEPICSKCYIILEMQPKKECSQCETMAPVCSTDVEGLPLCKNCYKPHVCESCGKGWQTVDQLSAHRRVHTEWAKQPFDEELIYKTALEYGFKHVSPKKDPKFPPAPGEFWRNVHVFPALRGENNGMLEADFIFGLSKTQSEWLEPCGATHYRLMPWDRGDRSRLEKQQRHDSLRREFATKTPPFPGLKFTEWNSTEKSRPELKEYVEAMFSRAGFRKSGDVVPRSSPH